MILRGPALTEGSRTLQLPRAASVPSAGARLAAKDVEVMPAPGVVAVEAAASDVAVYAPAELPHKEEITFEAVAAWLTVQDSETRQHCASMLADELTFVYEKARTDGFSVGKDAGSKAAQEESEAQVELLRGIVAQAETRFDADSAALANSCADVVAEALVKIGGRLLCTTEATLGAVEQVLKRVKEAREVTIRVNTADVATLVASESCLGAALAGRKFSIVADARVELGGCIVESKLGSLDGRFEAQLRELFESLRTAKATGAERA